MEVLVLSGKPYMQLKALRERVIRGLIFAEVAALPTMATFLYLPWLTSVERPASTVSKVAWLWPVGFVLCKDIFRTHLLSDAEEAVLRCFLAITWLKFGVLILLTDWLCRWRVSDWLVGRRRAVVLACLCPGAFTLLLDLSGNYYMVSDSLSPVIVLSLAVANVLVLLGIARLPWPRIRRASCSLPLWLAWIWWWKDLRFRLDFDIMDGYVALRVLVPLLGFALYTIALETDVERATPQGGPVCTSRQASNHR